LMTLYRFIALSGALACSAAVFGQAAPARQPNSATTFRVAVDGLACTALAQGTFEAQTFQIAVTDAISGGGAGAGKVVLSDLLIQKAPDACSTPLVVLAAGGRAVKRAVLTEVDKGNRPILTITLDNVLIVAAQVIGSQSADAVEQLNLSYASVTITDAAGNTTGSISR
jgi:type VI protein secretion system component Hcp